MPLFKICDVNMAWVVNWLKNLLGARFYVNDDDIVVFVVGPSGSGKSTFVNAVTKAGLKVGQDLRPTTERVQAVRCELTEEKRSVLGEEERMNIVFIDTPSFHTWDDNGAEEKLNTWLKRSKFRSTRVGTVYMHRVEVDPSADMESSIQNHLDAFAYSFPTGFTSRCFPQRLHCVFTRVDNVSEDKVEAHKAEFQKQLAGLRPMYVCGERLTWDTSTHPDVFAKGDPEIAWKVVVELFSPHEPTNPSAAREPRGRSPEAPPEWEKELQNHPEWSPSAPCGDGPIIPAIQQKQPRRKRESDASRGDSPTKLSQLPRGCEWSSDTSDRLPRLRRRAESPSTAGLSHEDI